MLTLTLERQEAKLLRTLVEVQSDKAQHIMLRNGQVGLSISEQQMLSWAKKVQESLLQASRRLIDLVDSGARRRLLIVDEIEALRDDLECVEESEKAAIQALIDSAPASEEYKLDIDRTALKEIVRILDEQIDNIRTFLIPSYLKKDDSSFKQPKTKVYYVNRLKKNKEILERLAIKCRKRL